MASKFRRRRADTVRQHSSTLVRQVAGAEGKHGAADDLLQFALRSFEHHTFMETHPGDVDRLSDGCVAGILR